MRFLATLLVLGCLVGCASQASTPQQRPETNQVPTVQTQSQTGAVQGQVKE